MLYFKIKTGFGANDYISIDQEDYVKAVRAQVTGKVAMLKGARNISGSAIQLILPDYGKTMGYKPEYPISERDTPKEILKQFDDLEIKTKSELGMGEVKKLN